MKRLIAIILPVPIAAGAFALIVWYLTYGIVPTGGEEWAVDGLGAPVTVLFQDGAASLEVSSTDDAAAAVGYAQAVQADWQALVLRQAALGNLSAWFGSETTDMDAVVRAAGVPSGAPTAFETLSPEHKRMLERYAAGMRAGLDRGAAGASELTLTMRPVPIRWEPWHAIAIERLYALLAANRSLATAAHGRVSNETGALDSLTKFLAFEGAGLGSARVLQSLEGRNLACVLTSGSSSLPYFHPSLVKTGAVQTAGFVLVGTPFAFAYASERESACWLAGVTAGVDTVRSEAAVQSSALRIADGAGAEKLFRFVTTDRGWRLTGDSPWDSLVVRWSGHQAGSDAAKLLGWIGGRGDPAGAGLFQFTALALTGGRAAAHPYGADPLGTVTNGPWPGSGFSGPVLSEAGALYSPWAAHWAPALASGYRGSDPLLLDAVTYLRNWDYTFDPASIAASVLDTWAAAFRPDGELGSRGRRAGVRPVWSLDTTAVNTPIGRRLMQEGLATAVASLQGRFGDNPDTWRWEDVRPSKLRIPAARAVAARAPGLYSTRFGPIRVGGGGHPTSLHYGPSAADDSPVSASALRLSDRRPDASSATRPALQLGRPFGRFLDRTVMTQSRLFRAPPTAVHRLVPTP